MLMRWKEFNNLADKEFTTLGSTWYHMTVTFRGTKVITFFANNIGLSPNLVSVISALFAVTAMGLILCKPNDLGAGLLSLLSLQLCFMSDCADGMLARIQNRTSRFGTFLDNFLDTFNHYVVFIGFGIAWTIKSPDEVCIKNVILYVIGASLYTFYYETSMIRGYIFRDLKGTVERLDKNWRQKVLKTVYSLINRGVHYLLLSVAYLLGVIHWVVLLYGILGMALTVAMVVYVYLSDRKHAV